MSGPGKSGDNCIRELGSECYHRLISEADLSSMKLFNTLVIVEIKKDLRAYLTRED